MKDIKFQYKENVEVIHGFLRTQKAIIVDVNSSFFGFGEKRYEVYLNTVGSGRTLTIPESYLRSLDNKNVEFDKKLQKVIK